jgi:glycerol-3-phosphate acyltransferase PlsX
MRRIGIDLMGGDANMPALLVEAAVQAAALLPETSFVLFGTLPILPPKNANIAFEEVVDVISMEDNPVAAVKKKPGSSLVCAIRALQQGRIDGCISCGNTGALIAASKLYLPSLPQIERPALLADLLSTTGVLSVIDVGGNISAKASHLVQFALFGSQYRRVRYGQKRPKVALLNIGTEAQKGTKELCDAYSILSNMSDAPFQFVGNVEGHDAFTRDTDVLVTNGFAGNIFLKTAEGVAAFVLAMAERRMVAPMPLLQELKSTLSHDASSGALVAGVDGLVVKCHGNSSKQALVNAIVGIDQLIKRNLMETLRCGDSSSSHP